jgi:hypothetical protein
MAVDVRPTGDVLERRNRDCYLDVVEPVVKVIWCNEFVSNDESGRSAQYIIASRQPGLGWKPHVRSGSEVTLIGWDVLDECVDLRVGKCQQRGRDDIADDQVAVGRETS